jgi:hypothetical protein
LIASDVQETCARDRTVRVSIAPGRIAVTSFAATVNGSSVALQLVDRGRLYPKRLVIDRARGIARREPAHFLPGASGKMRNAPCRMISG